MIKFLSICFRVLTTHNRDFEEKHLACQFGAFSPTYRVRVQREAVFLNAVRAAKIITGAELLTMAATRMDRGRQRFPQ